jgi:ankyrin repeat protein
LAEIIDLCQKTDIVQAIHNHFHSHSSNGSRYNSALEDSTAFHMSTSSKTSSSYLLENPRETPDDYNQMSLLLREIIPFYGQGDGKTDTVVQQTMAKLPKIYLDMQDARLGNTILMLCIQHGILDLVPLLLQKGCDPNIPNYDGSMGLHFLCDPESLEIAQVCIESPCNALSLESISFHVFTILFSFFPILPPLYRL